MFRLQVKPDDDHPKYDVSLSISTPYGHDKLIYVTKGSRIVMERIIYSPSGRKMRASAYKRFDTNQEAINYVLKLYRERGK